VEGRGSRPTLFFSPHHPRTKETCTPVGESIEQSVLLYEGESYATQNPHWFLGTIIGSVLLGFRPQPSNLGSDLSSKQN